MKPELIETGLQTLCPKIWNTAELFNFIEKAVFAKAGEDLNREADCKERNKQVFPRIVMPESAAEILLNNGKQITIGKAIVLGRL